MKRFAFISLLVFSPFFGSVFAQTLEVISAGGDYTESAGGSLASTVGEVMIETVEGTSNHLTQGFHQPDIYVLSIQNFRIDFDVSVYPNPTTDIINIKSSKTSNLIIYDASGKVVYNQAIAQTDQVSMGQFSEGIYHLVFRDENEILKSLKVVVQ